MVAATDRFAHGWPALARRSGRVAASQANSAAQGGAHYHQEHLPGADAREPMRRRWQGAQEKLEKLLKKPKAAGDEPRSGWDANKQCWRRARAGRT
jgi:hypothetical protein